MFSIIYSTGFYPRFILFFLENGVLMRNKIFFIFFFLASCTRPDGPSEVIYIKKPSPYHVVSEGETLESIAKRYGMETSELSAINQIQDSSTLIVGQRVLVRPIPIEERHEAIIEQPLKTEDMIPPSLEEETAKTNEERENNTKIEKPQQPSTKPYIWPVKGKIIEHFNKDDEACIRISIPANLPVVAVADGTVKTIKKVTKKKEEISSYGNMIILTHHDGNLSIYAHLGDITLKTPKKDDIISVKKGQVIGRTGDSGLAKGKPQLFLQIRDKDLNPLNPLNFLP